MSLNDRRKLSAVSALLFAGVFASTMPMSPAGVVLCIWGAGMNYRTMMYWSKDEEQ